jgi:hypothetical protein
MAPGMAPRLRPLPRHLGEPVLGLRQWHPNLAPAPSRPIENVGVGYRATHAMNVRRSKKLINHVERISGLESSRNQYRHTSCSR